MRSWVLVLAAFALGCGPDDDPNDRDGGASFAGAGGQLGDGGAPQGRAGAEAAGEANPAGGAPDGGEPHGGGRGGAGAANGGSLNEAGHGNTTPTIGGEGGAAGAPDCSGEILTVACGLPPDPRDVAPALDPTKASTTYDGNAFLFEGPNPTQRGVTDGVMDPTRIAVLHGRVLDSDEGPLPGVRVAVLGHAEYGFTLSREDGRFDLAINGGGLVSLTYERPTHLPSQRKVLAEPLGHGHAPDVVLVPLDPKVTVVPLAQPTYQYAQGTLRSDDDGSRQMTVVFPPELQATIERADGTLESLAQLSFRATEYTVGKNGPRAMPADLPASTVYTFAAELSADEALERGVKVDGKDVVFDKPVSFFVENFLGWPVGTPVPLGYFDSTTAQWVPEPSGVVLEVVDVVGGLAEIDTNGDGVADAPEVLSDLGFTEGERAQLGSLYLPGAELWRTRMTHLSSHDWNVPYSPPSDARGTLGELKRPHVADDDCTKSGSVIECTNQILREEIPLPGTGMSLTYESDRAPGRTADRTVVIPITDANPPPSLSRVLVEVYVAGQAHYFAYDSNNLRRDGDVFGPNQEVTFTWDGRDAYGRPMNGRIHGAVRIGYEFPVMFGSSNSFGGPARQREDGEFVELSEAREAYVFWRTQLATFDVWDDRGAGLGGWRLSQHHQFDPEGGVLHYGYGGRRSVQGATMQPQPIGQRGLGEIALTPDGSVIGVSPVETIAYRYDRDGNESRFAGGGSAAPDGVPATDALLPQLQSVAAAPDGTVFLGGGGKVFRVTPEGMLTIVMGRDAPPKACGQAPSTGAANSVIVVPYSMAVHPDGRLFVASRSCGLLILMPDGQVDYAGGVGAPDQPVSVAIGVEGEVFVLTTWGQAFVLNPNGSWSHWAGDWLFGNANCWAYNIADPATGQFGPATKACLRNAKNITTDRSGAPYIGMSRSGSGLWRIKNGIISVAIPDLSVISRAEFLPSGEFYYVGSPTGLLNKMSAALPGLTWAQGAIASDDGSLLFVTDRSGKQLETRSAVSGATLQTLAYDEKGRLSRIEDADDNAVRIDRSDELAPVIVGPDGHSTKLTVAADGYLSRVNLPNGDHFDFGYTANGLLTSMTDRRGGQHAFAYDGSGRLTSDTNATGVSQTLSRSGGQLSDEVASASKVEHQTPQLRTTSYLTEVLQSDDVRRTVTLPDGTSSASTRNQLGGETSKLADGTVVTRVASPDPRWGTQASYVSELDVKTPGGLAATLSRQRSAVLEDPKDRLSLQKLTENLVVNGRPASRSYDAATRTWTLKSAAQRTSTVVVDEQARPVRVAVPGIEPVEYHYDARGRIDSISQGTLEPRVTTLSYGADGFVETLTDAAQNSVTFTRDANGRIVEQWLPGDRSIGFGYDANDNVAWVKPPGKPSHGLKYTLLDALASYEPPPLSGIATPNTTFEYDADGAATQTIRADQRQVDYHYDATGRPWYIDLPAGNDLPAEAVTLTYFGAGQVESVAHSGGVGVSFGYDGFLITSETVSGVVPGNVVLHRGYDADFRMNSEAIGSEEALQFAYDADGLLKNAGSLTLLRASDTGFLTGTSLGVVTDEFFYDAFGQSSGYAAKAGNAELYKTALSVDEVGRIKKKTETIGGATTIFEYAYDAAGRLGSVTKDEQLLSSYTYDDNGNRLTAGLGPVLTASYDDQDRMLKCGSAAFTYTDAGELRTKLEGGQTTTYSYDAQGNLRSVVLPDSRNIEYMVDGLGRRVGKRVDGQTKQTFVYRSALAPAAELDAAGNVVSRFVYGTKVNVPEYMVRGGISYRIITDHLGSPRLIVNTTTGAIAQRIDYDAWGVILSDTNPGFQPFGFAGGIYDNDTKLVRFGARDYDAESGVWLSRDPLLFGGGQTNLRAYCDGDPINRTDPQGKSFALDLLEFYGVFSDVNDAHEKQGTLPGAMNIANLGVGAIALLFPGTQAVALTAGGAGLLVDVLDRLADWGAARATDRLRWQDKMAQSRIMETNFTNEMRAKCARDPSGIICQNYCDLFPQDSVCSERLCAP